MNIGIGIDLGTYIPRWVRCSLAEARSDNAFASAEARPAAILLFDIAGFTETTDRLEQLGEHGAEQLSELLNDCFAILTDVVDEHGGDIVSFTGDGFLALWDAAESMQASHLAAQCALALRDAMGDWAQASDSRFRERICVDMGLVHYCRLGGHRGVWRYLVVGEPFQSLGSAYRKTQVRQVLLCDRVWRSIGEHCEGEAGDGVFELRRLKTVRKVRPLPPVRDANPTEYRSLAPAVVLERMDVGAPKWLAEFRILSILYVSFAGVQFDHSLIELLQPCIVTLQRVVRGLEGVIFGVWMDDKGICAAALFGTPSHEDDALRAVEAGLRMRRELKRHAIRMSIGISSGRLFCGDIGGRTRRDYGVFGPVVNTAARLMQMADGGVLCDAATVQAVDRRVSFVVLQAQRLKGRAVPIPLYRPMEILPKRQVFHEGELIGREPERQQLRVKLAQLKAGTGGLVIVQGEPGIGKSRLLGDLAEAASELGVVAARGYASAIYKSTPYFAWRQVVLALLEPDLEGRSDALQVRVAARLRHQPTLVSWLPLLRDIVPLALAETPLTEQIAGAARAASIEAILIGLLLHSPVAPRLLIFEDLHWFDEASLSLLRGVTRHLPQLLVVVSRRLPERMAVQDLRLAEDHVLEITLEELPADAIAEIVRRRLHATEVSQELLSFVLTRAGGNPFYGEELASALRDAGSITETRGADLTPAESLAATKVPYPASLENAIVARVDALRADAQLLLKVASAIGGPFTADALQGLYPGALSPQEIQERLDQLVDREILRVARNRSPPQYRFRHAISEEVTYRLLPFGQRQLLHAAIATALEAENPGDLEPYYDPLARHWERAQEFPRAIRYLELAAEQALRSYANREAIRYVWRAFDLSTRTPAQESAERFALWETILGDAYNELADYHQSLPHYERALLLEGHRIARSGRERAGFLIRNLATQAWRRIVPPRVAWHKTINCEADRRAAHIRERLAERHFFRNESVAVLDETLAAVNLAERGGAVTEMISGYSALALGLGMSGLHTLGRFYQRRAMNLAQQFDLTPESARAYLLAAVFGFGTGDWDIAKQLAARSLAMYRQLGDPIRALTPLTILASVHVLCGELEEAERLVVESSDATLFQSTAQGQAWRLTAKVMISAIRGSVEADDIGQLVELVDSNLTRADQLLCLGTAASGYLRRGDMSNAIAAAERGLDVLRDTGKVWGNYIYGVAGVIDVFLTGWAMSKDSPALGADARAKTLTAYRHARRAARMSPVCQPQLLLLRGRIVLLSGRPRGARRIWMKAACSAEKLQMRREHGLALFEIGRIARRSDPERVAKLSRAAAIFEAIGAHADFASARQAMTR
jgi:class 3 adenylate cyclase/tetratricopeptide (TPR) repeat protein